MSAEGAIGIGASIERQSRPLIDPQGRVIDYLRISVTDRCNYGCTYCMPDDGVEHADRADVLSFEEIAALVRVFAALGVRRVRLTGGEPTVRRDLVSLVRLLRDIPGIDDIALSTNGHRLPELAAPLRAAGVDRLNVSLDSLDAERFRRITRRGELSRVIAGIEAARAAGFTSIKLNTVALGGVNDDEFDRLAGWAWARGLIPRFIEEMPMAGGRAYDAGAQVSAAEIRRRVAAGWSGARVVADDEGGGPNPARGGGPARYFRLEQEGGGGGAAGEPARRFGIISAMTEHFCTTCNRLRLSTAGALHACLAHDDAVDLRGPLHAGGTAAVTGAIQAALAAKRPGHTFQLIGLGGPRKAMVQIGG
ncbi:MAG TPA: GTP 3',8-cyclase MoaA [Polyangia bacterium]|jgi:cyclic pyranopterin phosphate synthase